MNRITSFIKSETSNLIHNVKAGIIALAMVVYFIHSTVIDSFYPEGGWRFWDFMFASWCFIFALIAQALSLSKSKLLRFFSGMAVAWFLSDALMFIFPHNPSVVTERNKSDYLIIVAVLILGCVHYHANTKLFNLLVKWQKKRR